MEISPDAIVFWRWGAVNLNATILFTWLVMALMVAGSRLITRRLTGDTRLTYRQNLLEALVTGIEEQIREVGRQEPRQFLPFIGALFLFIALSNILSIVPGYLPPTGSLSTTTALAISVFIVVPVYGIAGQGLKGYLKHYVEPSFFMLPFNVMGELSRTIALAVRLFGNVMSGTMIAAILLSIAPLFFPVLMQLLGLLVGLIQAYIFAVLAMVYIASAARAYREKEGE